MNLKGLDIILTYECTGRCAHCCYRAGPGQNNTMTLAEVESYLAAVEDQPLEWILLFGGEPFLPYELLRSSVALAAPMAEVLVFTNGYWATELDTARRLLAGLQEIGLDHILFSVDAFHQTRVSIERVVIGLKAARELGYRRIEIDNNYVGEPGADNPFNRRTRENMRYLAELCDLSDVQVHQGMSRMVGRAADTLGTCQALQTGPFDKCLVPGWLGDDIRAPTTVEIHPGGWVNLCAGIALGNTERRPLDKILAEYDPDSHPIVSVLAAEGPIGLMRIAERHGHASSWRYVDGCHLCYQARRFLRPYYPDHLAPSHLYIGDE